MTRKEQHNQLARALARWDNKGGAIVGEGDDGRDALSREEELSDRLADLGRHNGCPVAVTVKFGTVKSGASSISSGHLRQSKP